MEWFPEGGNRFWRWGVTLPGIVLLLAGLALRDGAAVSGPAADLLMAEPAAAAAPEAAAPLLARHERELRPGETLSGALAAMGLDRDLIHDACNTAARWLDLRRLRPGVRLAAHRDSEEAVQKLEIALDGKGVLALERAAESWEGVWRDYERTTATRAVRGELDGGFEAAVVRAGAPADLAYAVAEVLQWDLDFNRDLQRGDTFEILFEERFVEGDPAGLGEVLAVRYRNRGRSIEAYRFAQGAYYDAEGRPLQKMFLRAPLQYTRISSRFSGRRLHPVLKVHRPHYGVDYAAPKGTPVRVTAAGVVSFLGWDGGGGQTVKVRHPNGYLTAYLHLFHYAAGLKAGDRVRQGEVIGYVGATGLATGPHLDYRVQQHGRWIDPQRLGSVPADPVPTTRLAEYQQLRDAMRASLTGDAPFPPPAIPAPESRLAAATALPGERGTVSDPAAAR
jgi:murein DD-endopeptidase MepM/ murein hydrolase activator NlpD